MHCKVCQCTQSCHSHSLTGSAIGLNPVWSDSQTCWHAYALTAGACIAQHLRHFVLVEFDWQLLAQKSLPDLTLHDQGQRRRRSARARSPRGRRETRRAPASHRRADASLCVGAGSEQHPHSSLVPALRREHQQRVALIIGDSVNGTLVSDNAVDALRVGRQLRVRQASSAANRISLALDGHALYVRPEAAGLLNLRNDRQTQSPERRKADG